MPEYHIRDLVNMFEGGSIYIPWFQREFVWSDHQIVTLAESIYKQYPIGIMVFYPLIEKERGMQYGVLDGQQRLLSMVLMMRGKVRTVTGEWELNIWFNVKNKEFRASKREPGNGWVRLSDVISISRDDFRRLGDIANKVSEELGIPLNEALNRLNELWMIFNDYKVPVHVTTEETDPDRLGEIFVRINFAGTRVRSADVNYTMLAIVNEDIAKLMREFYHELANAQVLDYEWDLEYAVIVRTFLAFLTGGRVRLESTVLRQARKLKEVLSEKKHELGDIWALTRSSLIEAIKILMDDEMLAIKSSKSRFLLSQTPLVTMAYYVGRKHLSNSMPIPVKEKYGLLGWFILSSYYRRYSSASETRLNEDLQVIARGGSYKDLVRNLKKSIGELRISEETYQGSGSDKIFLLYVALRSRKARDFYSRDVLIYDRNASIHHIFPVNVIGGKYSRVKVDDVANLTLILQSSNESIRESPHIYLRKLPSEILEEHLIPTNEDLWREERFEDFLNERRKLLVKTINTYLERLGVLKGSHIQ